MKNSLAQIANRLADVWPSSHPLSITAAVALVTEKLPADFQELSGCQRETDSIALLSAALVKLGVAGIEDGQVAGSSNQRLHEQPSAIHRPDYHGNVLNLA